LCCRQRKETRKVDEWKKKVQKRTKALYLIYLYGSPEAACKQILTTFSTVDMQNVIIYASFSIKN